MRKSQSKRTIENLDEELNVRNSLQLNIEQSADVIMLAISLTSEIIFFSIPVAYTIVLLVNCDTSWDPWNNQSVFTVISFWRQ